MFSKYLLRERFFANAKGPCLWLHGASLGECKVLVNIARRIFDEGVKTPLLITTQKAEIVDVLKKMVCDLPNVGVSIAPAPIGFFMDRFCKTVQPIGLVLCENELWPAYLNAMKRYGKKIALVSGRFKNSAPWARLDSIDFANFQTQGDLARFQKKANGLCDGKGFTVRGHWKLLQGKVCNGNRGFVESRKEYDIAFLSVHLSEWNSIAPLLCNYASLGKRILLVPRRLEEIAQFKKELKTLGVDSVHIVEQFGVLHQYLPLCAAAVMGGSFVEFPGIHNFMEPLELGIPTFVGPYCTGEKEFTERFLRMGILVRIAAGAKTLPCPLATGQEIVKFIAEEKKSVELGFAELLAELKEWKLQ